MSALFCMRNLWFRPVPLILATLATVATGSDGIAATAAGELAEVVVTATLRPLPEQHVAGSVTVLDRDTLHDAGQQHLEETLALIPNLNWSGDSNRPRYFQLRGIGELEQYEGAPNPSVGFLIDDIDFSGLGGAATLFDVAQVEVLRGPQGTRYGANALAGLIYVTSAAPQEQFGGHLEASTGTYGTHSLGGVVTGPIAALDSTFRLAAQRESSDGYYYNDYLHRHDTNGRDELTLRGRWHYQPSDVLALDVSALHVQLDNGYDAFAVDNSRTTHSDHPGSDAQHSTGASARLTYSGLAAKTLTAIATYADTRVRYGYDGDWGNNAYWSPYIYDFTELQQRHRLTATTELRLASAPAAGASWLVGAYAMSLRERFSDTSAGLSVDPLYGTYQQDTLTDSSYQSRTLAVFGVLESDPARKLHGSVGLRGERHSADYSDLVQDRIYDQSSAHAFHPNEVLWGGHASLSYELSQRSSAYLQAARGFKAGGFNLSQGLLANEIAFRPESDWNLETGYKLRSIDRRWSLNVAAFALFRRDAQIKTSVQTDPTNPNTFILYTGNAASGTNYGAELAGRWQWSRRLTLGATLGLLHTSFHDFVRVADSGTQSVSRELADAPRWQAAVDATYRNPNGLFARLDVSGRGSFYFDLPPNPTRSSPYALVNAKIGWESAQWSVYAWCRNLTDRNYPVRGFYFGLEPPDYPNKLYVQWGEPRTFGASASYRFGGAVARDQ